MNEIIGMIISLVGMLFNIASLQVRKKGNLLLVQTLGAGTFMISYFFAGGGIGMMLNALILGRNFLLMAIGKRKGKPLVLSIIGLCILYLGGYLVYTFAIAPQESLSQKLWNLLPVAGAVIGTVGLGFANLNLFRLIKMGDSGCWLAYNGHIGLGALGGILCEVFSICSAVVGIIRFRRLSFKGGEDEMREEGKRENEPQEEGNERV